MFDQLPQEVVWEILNYMSLEELESLAIANVGDYTVLLTLFWYLQKRRLAAQVPGTPQYMQILQVQAKIAAALEAYLNKLVQQQSNGTAQ